MFVGSGTALITPFKNGLVDYDAFTSIIHQQLDGNIDCLLFLGTTGEASTISVEEKIKIIELAVKEVNKKVPVIIGTGCNCTATAIENSKRAEKLGADGLLVVSPYYNKCTQKGLIAHYNMIADSVNIPVIAYNVPGRTGVNILPETMAEIAKHPNICGLKEASGNLEQIEKVIGLTKGLCSIWSGDDGIIVELMKMGGKGVFSVASNVTPRYVHDLTSKCLEGDYETAQKMQDNYKEFVKALFSEVNPIPVKQAMAYLGLCANELRMPLTTMENETAAKLKSIMDKLGITK